LFSIAVAEFISIAEKSEFELVPPFTTSYFQSLSYTTFLPSARYSLGSDVKVHHEIVNVLMGAEEFLSESFTFQIFQLNFHHSTKIVPGHAYQPFSTIAKAYHIVELQLLHGQCSTD